MSNVHDVIIVGCGPVGATLANLLGARGRRVAIADAYADVYDKPRAINLDQEALRTLQTAGLVDEIIEGCEPHPGTDFLGADGELIKYIYSAKPPYPLGWPANLMFVQPKAERILREGFKRYPNIDVWLGSEATGLVETGDHVTVDFRHADGTAFTAAARYVIACDGANSPIRKSLGIGQEDLGFSEWWLVVDAWLKGNPALPPRSTQYCFPDAPTTYIVCSGNLRRWEMKIVPGEDPQRYASMDNIKARMARFVDPDALEFWRSAVYHFHARVTNQWRKGRVLIAGDAAHQMPPFMGQGLCAGFRDAVNLAWKIDMVLAGTAAPDLLATYEEERKPHIHALTAVTVGLGQIIGETDLARAAERDRRLRDDLTSGKVETVRQNLIPPLEHGLIDRDATGLKSNGAGTLAVQPMVEGPSGPMLLDELTGPNFVLLLGDGLAATDIDPALTEDFTRRGGRIVAIGEREDALREAEQLFAGWMRSLGAQAAIVRPDRYVYGSARDAAGLDQLMRGLRVGLGGF